MNAMRPAAELGPPLLYAERMVVSRVSKTLVLQKFRNWRDSLTSIDANVDSLLLGRHNFRTMQEVIATNRSLDGLFVKWLRINYATSVALGIRRQVDTDAKANSLVNLLCDLIKHSQVLTRDRYMALKNAGWRARYTGRNKAISRPREPFLSWSNQFFDEFAEAGESAISKRVIGEHLKLLRQRTRDVERFATKRLAHYDFVDPPKITFSEIDAALDTLDVLLTKYSTLLDLDWRPETNAMKYRYLDWWRVFEFPWARADLIQSLVRHTSDDLRD